MARRYRKAFYMVRCVVIVRDIAPHAFSFLLIMDQFPK